MQLASVLQAGEPKPPSESDFAVVEVRSLEEATATLAHCQDLSANWAPPLSTSARCSGGGWGRPLLNSAHSFLRVVLTNPQLQRWSALHVVDLVGALSLNGVWNILSPLL